MKTYLDNLYSKSSKNNPLDIYSSVSSEISIRNELINTLQGLFSEEKKRQNGVIRTMRRDSLGKLIKCSCNDSASGEPDKTTPCPYCSGEGNLWDETLIDFYRWEPGYDSAKSLNESLTKPGTLNIPIKIFYIAYSEDLTLDDKLIELVLDKEGLPILPYQRRSIYRFGTLNDLRLDDGRLEYWKVLAYQDKMLPLTSRG
jgi:hypothetical protein